MHELRGKTIESWICEVSGASLVGGMIGRRDGKLTEMLSQMEECLFVSVCFLVM